MLATRFGLIVLVTWALVGCSRETTPNVLAPSVPTPSPAPPPAPPVPPGVPTFLWGMVIDGSGICVPNATIEIVDGQAVGQRIRQETPCGAWDYGGGFTIKELTSGVALTVRASAPGFVTQEETFVPTPGPMYRAVFVTLSRE